MTAQGSSTLNTTENGLKPPVSILMVPFPAQGHLNQLLHLSYLISSYGVPVHFTGSPSHNRQAKLRLQGWQHSAATQEDEDSLLTEIQFHDFELPPYEIPPPNPNQTNHFPSHLIPLWETSMSFRQPLFELLKKMSSEHRRVIVIYDTLMAYVVQDLRSIVNVESYCFFPGCAFTLFTGLYDLMDRKLPFELDSDVIPMSKVPTTEGTITEEMAEFYKEKVGKYSGMENGSLYNTSRVIEDRYTELVERITNKKSFAIGPVNPVQIAIGPVNPAQRNKFLEWLDKQEKDSVIYVSFGTMTSITDEQIEELAIGLEKSGQKFVWVLRDADKGDVFTENGEVRRLKLPQGYEERVKERGIIVREWAPQLEILAHSSTGGFMSHCGWNSCMESISMGVPIATWPMHSDQPRNAVLVTEVLRIGTVVKDWARRGTVIRSGEVERAVVKLIGSEEGVEMRKRAVKLGEDVRRSISDGGCSRLEMESFVAHITR